MHKFWAHPTHGMLILAEGGGGAFGPMLDPPLYSTMGWSIVDSKPHLHTIHGSVNGQESDENKGGGFNSVLTLPT